VIAIRATVGKCLRVPPHLDGANLTQGTAKVSPGKRISTEFLLPLINSVPFQNYLDRMAKGATFKEITLETLRKTPVLIPASAEQREIASHVENVGALVDDLVGTAENAIRLLMERRAGLISAAVTGKIDVRGRRNFADAA
jgi:type I restriction enzyme, S subunit